MRNSLRAKTDRLGPLQAKMEEFIANGAVLGFLIDLKDGCAHIYRPGTNATDLG
ncbi:MAG: hypothetical protein KDN22_06260 [Verrucomicrobiae bacterium]|nr:hypothetical protein [Verrucomicrobiae bacterium]